MNKWVSSRGLAVAALLAGSWGCGPSGSVEQQSDDAGSEQLGSSRQALAATGSGLDYLSQCQAHGVPQPNGFSTASVLPNGSYDLAYWTKGADALYSNALTDNGAAKIYSFASVTTGREGLCVIAAHIPKGGGTGGQFDMICQGRSGYACFWEKTLPPDPPPPASQIGPLSLDGGTALATNGHAPCTACHLGRNAFIAHHTVPVNGVLTGDGLSGIDDPVHMHQDWPLAAGSWYTPIVPSSFPDNAVQSTAGYPSSCLGSCHVPGGNPGPFPPLRDSALSANYCLILDAVVRRPPSLGGMPPGSSCTSVNGADCPATTDPEVQQMLAACGNPQPPQTAFSLKSSPVVISAYGSATQYSGLWDHVLAGSDVSGATRVFLSDSQWSSGTMSSWLETDYSSELKSSYRSTMFSKDGDGSKLTLASTDANGKIWEKELGSGAGYRAVSTVVAAGSPYAYKRFDGYNIIVFRGVDNYIYEAYWTGSAWNTNRLQGPAPDRSLKATGDPIAYNRSFSTASTTGTASVIYKCADLICEFRLINSTWQFRAIRPQMPLKYSSMPVPVKRGYPADYMIFYVATDGLHVIDDPSEPSFGSTSNEAWVSSDPNIVSSPAPYNAQDGGVRVAYVSDLGASLKEAVLPYGSNAANAGSWTVATRVLPDTSAAPLVGDPAALVDSMARNTIMFRNSAGTIYQLQTPGAGVDNSYNKSTVQKGYNINTTGSVTQNQEQAWDLNLPPGQYKFDLAPSSGDADLYMKVGDVATTSNYTCRPYSSSTTPESCTWTLPGPNYGRINIMVRGYNPGTSGFSLRGYYNN